MYINNSNNCYINNSNWRRKKKRSIAFIFYQFLLFFTFYLFSILGVNDNSLTENMELGSIHDELVEAYENDQPLDAFCFYL